MKSADGKSVTLYHVTISVDGGQLAEFDDLDFVDVELTKEVQVYRASPDPMYYSYHAAGLPSSVHCYALTAERPAADVRLEASAYAHVWTAPERPEYRVTIRNLHGKPRDVKLALMTKSLDGKQSTAHESTVRLQ